MLYAVAHRCYGRAANSNFHYFSREAVKSYNNESFCQRSSPGSRAAVVPRKANSQPFALDLDSCNAEGSTARYKTIWFTLNCREERGWRPPPKKHLDLLLSQMGRITTNRASVRGADGTVTSRTCFACQAQATSAVGCCTPNDSYES